MTSLRGFGLLLLFASACRGKVPEPAPNEPVSSAVAIESVALGAPVRVPSTTTTLQPPPGFTAASKFPGFESAEQEASLMVTEVPSAFQEIAKAMTKEALAPHGIRVLSSQAQKLSGRDALLVNVEQRLSGKEVSKWMLVAGNQQTTATLVATYPKSAPGRLGEQLRRSLQTASWRDAGPRDPFEGLAFSVKPTARLKLATRIGNTLMYTESGNAQPSEPTEAWYIVGSSPSDAAITDLAAFSRTRAGQTTTVKELSNLTGRAVELDSLPAYELLADAKDAKTGAALRFYQVIAQEGAGYFLVQGLMGARRAAALLPELRGVTRSFRRSAPR